MLVLIYKNNLDHLLKRNNRKRLNKACKTTRPKISKLQLFCFFCALNRTKIRIYKYLYLCFCVKSHKNTNFFHLIQKDIDRKGDDARSAAHDNRCFQLSNVDIKKTFYLSLSSLKNRVQSIRSA